MISNYLKALAVAIILCGFFSCKKESSNPKSKDIVITATGSVKADLGDTITINAQNLPSNVTVFFGTEQSNVVSNDGNAIRCTVPPTLKNVNSSVLISYNSKTDTLQNYFSLNAPSISTFTATGTFNDTITITGNHFDRFQGTVVKFGDAQSTATVISKTKLTVIVPNNVASSSTTLSVTSQFQTAASATQFQLSKPVFTVVPTSGHTNRTIVISGKNFSPIATANHIFLDGVEVPMSSCTNTQISFNIPYASYPRRAVAIKYQLLDFEIDYPTDLQLTDTWLMVSNTVPFNSSSTSGAVTIGNNGYVLAPPYGFTDYTYYIWKFDPTTVSWTKISIPFTTSSTTKFATNGSKIYLYISDAANDFYEYDPVANTWSQKQAFPGTSRSQPAMFCIGSKIYLGLGTYYVQNTLTGANDWYAYDTNAGTWTQVADFPKLNNTVYPRPAASTFVINNNGYVVCSGADNILSDGYKYNPGTNAWSRIADFPDPRGYTTAVALNNKGYVFNGLTYANIGNQNNDAFSYDPVADQWNILSPITTKSYIWGIAFVLNGKVYVDGGITSEQDDHTLYQGASLP